MFQLKDNILFIQMFSDDLNNIFDYLFFIIKFLSFLVLLWHLKGDTKKIGFIVQFNLWDASLNIKEMKSNLGPFKSTLNLNVPISVIYLHTYQKKKKNSLKYYFINVWHLTSFKGFHKRLIMRFFPICQNVFIVSTMYQTLW